MYLSKSDLTKAFTNALWAFYPICSIALFVEAVVIAGMYKRITDPHNKKLARYFLIAFLPQIAFSIIDFLLFKHIAFQLTHLSYAAFSVMTFVDLASGYFKHYSIELNITHDNDALKNRFALSDREMEVTVLLAKGLPYRSICEQLHISENTVKSHIKRIYKKLGVSNKLQMVNLLSSIRPNYH
jgi:DNA-binding CsgD family transcriptional regulator